MHSRACLDGVWCRNGCQYDFIEQKFVYVIHGEFVGEAQLVGSWRLFSKQAKVDAASTWAS